MTRTSAGSSASTSAPGKGTESGFVSHFNDDEAARRATSIYEAVELDPRYVMPWNAYPWVRDPDLPSALNVQEKTDGLRPFRQFLKINKRVSAVIAHGADAHAFLTLFEKTYHSSLKNRGVKIYKATALGGRAFAVSAAKQEELLSQERRGLQGRHAAGRHPAPLRCHAPAASAAGPVTPPAASAGA